MESAVRCSEGLRGASIKLSSKAGFALALASVAVLAAACGSEPEQVPAAGNTASSKIISRAAAIERGEGQIVRGSGGPAPAEPKNAVARLMPWSIFKLQRETVPQPYSGGGYGEPDPDDPMWIVQMETEWPAGLPHEAGALVFAILALDAATGLQAYVVWSTDPLILPQDYFDPEERLGPLQYVVEPSRISHQEAVALVLERGRSITPDTPLRGRPDFQRVTADQVRYAPEGRFWRELQLQQPTDPRENRLGWLLTLPYEMSLIKHAGAFTGDGTQPPRVTEWGNVIFAILDDETGRLIGAGTEHQWNAEMSQDEYSGIWAYGRDLGWWRLWDKLRDLPPYERMPAELVARLSADAAAAPEPTPTPVPSAFENTANFAADPEVIDVVIGRVASKIGDVKLPDAAIPGFNLFSYWVVEVEEHVVGQTSAGEVTVVVNEGDANADGVKFRGARFPITMTLGDKVMVFFRQRPFGWPPLSRQRGIPVYAIPASPGTNGLLRIQDGMVEIAREGERVEVAVADFVAEVMSVGRLAGKNVGRVLPGPVPTPAPPSSELEAAGSLRAAIDSLPAAARIELSPDVVAVIRGLFDRVPLELDPVAGTDFAIYHVPSGSWTWSHEDNVLTGRSYKTLAAIEALETVARDPDVLADLIARVPE